MNYRHDFHAGNFADVVKHALLTRIVEHLKRKDKPFRVIDTHAGAGRYDLSGASAQRTGEWQGGVGRVLGAALPPEAAALLAPWLEAVRVENPPDGVDIYPGSPLLVRRLLRRQDRLTAIELHPEAVRALKALFAGDVAVKVIALDGWLVPGAQLPPREKRGLVLIDPPFEQPGEFERLVEALLTGWKRWPGGLYALWYPIKDRGQVARFRAALAGAGIPKILDLSLTVRAPSQEPRLDGCGLVVVNPPYTLDAEARTILSALVPVLAAGDGGGSDVVWLAGEA